MTRKFNKKSLSPDAPLLHGDHPRPISRREFIRQGFIGGSATLLSGGVFSLFANPNSAMAAVATDLQALATSIPGCTLGGLSGAAKVPFICFDLAGGANLAGSNVLVGQGGGQMDVLTTGGYSKLGIPGDMIPGLVDTGVPLINLSDGDFTNSALNLKFHADSAMLHGILEKAGAAVGNVEGCVIPARSDNDTGNNPHNPLYGISMAGAQGTVVDLIGSRSTDSGGNSLAPASQINPEVRPTKVDRPSDVTGMVDVGNLTAILGPDDVTAVMESIARVSHKKLKLGTISTGLSNDLIIKDLIRCGYMKAADLADRFAGVPVDPMADSNINKAVNAGAIFSANELNNDGEFRKTASVMKMVVNGFAAAGCITMGGYDYHTGDRTAGENRDLRAGRCIGACLSYAQRLGKPLMIYVFSDGSVASNGAPDMSVDSGAGETLVLGGRGKGQWTGDNSSTACSYFLVYSPTAAPTPIIANRQIGMFSGDGSVITSSSPAANNVNLLVNMLVLNYMAVNGDVSPSNTTPFTNLFPAHGLGSNLGSYIGFGTI